MKTIYLLTILSFNQECPSATNELIQGAFDSQSACEMNAAKINNRVPYGELRIAKCRSMEVASK